MATEMVDFAIVLIGLSCFASVLTGRHVFLGSALRSRDSDTNMESLVRRRQFTRFMHLNLTVAGAAIVIVLMSQGQSADPLLSVSAGVAESVSIN